MRGGRNPLFVKPRYLYGSILFVGIFLLFAAFKMADDDDFDIARREVLLRKIGHEILLQSGDSTSRVLPVKKVAENEYQIGFEKEFTFQSDSLVNITRRLLAQDPLTRDYVVNVLNCDSTGIAFGYAISRNKRDDIVACGGRKQPRACYMINIKFKPAVINTAKTGYLLGGLLFLGFAGFIVFRSVKPRRGVAKDATTPVLPEVQEQPPIVHESTNVFTLGTVLFDAQERQLTVDEKTMDLTRTETRLLLIFASSPNEIVERSRLQKEIWEDEGVIVGRSLDMFISKLRKKLESDPNVSIVAIRGKGYKLEISCEESVV